MQMYRKLDRDACDVCVCNPKASSLGTARLISGGAESLERDHLGINLRPACPNLNLLNPGIFLAENVQNGRQEIRAWARFANLGSNECSKMIVVWSSCSRAKA